MKDCKKCGQNRRMGLLATTFSDDLCDQCFADEVKRQNLTITIGEPEEGGIMVKLGEGEGAR